MLAENDVSFYTFGDYRLNVSNRTLNNKGVPVQLTQKSFELLQFLVQENGKVISKDDCFEAVWHGYIVDESNISQHIYRIRKVLKGNKDNVFIETIPKHGYRFVGKVEKTSNKAKKTNGLPPNSPSVIVIADEVTPSVVITPSLYSRITKGHFATGIAIFIILLLAFQLYFFNQKIFPSKDKQNQSVAVLPFKQIGDLDDERLGIGMADTIISKIGNLDEIVVLPIESVSSYTKEASEPVDQKLFEIGENLGVDILLTGTIQKESQRVRFNVKLYHVKSRRYLCAIKYDKVADDRFNLQDTIADQVFQKFTIDLKARADSKKSDAENDS